MLKRKYLLIDDHSIVRQGLSILIKKNISNSEIYKASTIAEALYILKREKINFIILDINLSDGEGIYSMNKIKHINNEAKILIFSALDEAIYALRYINAGADGYLSKIIPEQDMTTAILRFTETGKYFSSNIKELLFDNFVTKKSVNPISDLSDREIEVARLLVKGYGNLEISSTLDLKKSTVSTYKNRVFEKLNINNLSSLIDLFKLYDEQK